MSSFCQPKLRLLELYCGIGGMRYALQATGYQFEVVGAVDINPVVNDIYWYNFGKENHLNSNLCGLTAETIDNLAPDIITLSPPCQPFSRLGLKLDEEDERCRSFLHILSLIYQLTKKPAYILLENVVGFDSAIARNNLLKTLQECGYIYQELILSPAQFGIPNSRSRYYILAKLAPLQFQFQRSEELMYEIPCTPSDEINAGQRSCHLCFDSSEKCIIAHFLESKPESFFDQYLLTDSVLLKHVYTIDIVNKNSTNCCCFTKGYSHYYRGSGSVIQQSDDDEPSSVFEEASQVESDAERLHIFRKLKLRFFTPKEIANLMCLPEKFTFPSHITQRQRYRALGNSVNVHVVAKLLCILLSDWKERNVYVS